MYAQILKHVPVFCMLLAFLIVVFAITFGMLSLEKKQKRKSPKKRLAAKKRKLFFFWNLLKIVKY